MQGVFAIRFTVTSTHTQLSDIQHTWQIIKSMAELVLDEVFRKLQIRRNVKTFEQILIAKLSIFHKSVKFSLFESGDKLSASNNFKLSFS